MIYEYKFTGTMTQQTSANEHISISVHLSTELFVPEFRRFLVIVFRRAFKQQAFRHKLITLHRADDHYLFRFFKILGLGIVIDHLFFHSFVIDQVK